VEFALDEYANYIDTILKKATNNSIAHLLHQLSPADSLGFLYGCGTQDLSHIEPNQALQDTLEMLGLPYEYWEHDGDHTMPPGFKQRALIFLDSLMMGPSVQTGITDPGQVVAFDVFPNPFVDQIIISWEVMKEAALEVDLLNTLGQRVRAIHLGPIRPGVHRCTIDLSSEHHGIYFCRLRVGDHWMVRKVVKAE
jgi:hypothetical protein